MKIPGNNGPDPQRRPEPPQAPPNPESNGRTTDPLPIPGKPRFMVLAVGIVDGVNPQGQRVQVTQVTRNTVHRESIQGELDTLPAAHAKDLNASANFRRVADAFRDWSQGARPGQVFDLLPLNTTIIRLEDSDVAVTTVSATPSEIQRPKLAV